METLKRYLIFLVGFIARLIGKKLAFLKDMIFPESVSAEN